jgi:hypothetical protein
LKKQKSGRDKSEDGRIIEDNALQPKKDVSCIDIRLSGSVIDVRDWQF